MSADVATPNHPWREASPAQVRAIIARSILGVSADAPRLGEIVLAPHQQEAVLRVRRMFEESNGALLADAVGLGKTFVALALAREARRPLIIAPAALRDMWTDACARAGVVADLWSMERLSRGHASSTDAAGSTSGAAAPDLVIIDEAHHFRNAGTRRYAALARLTLRARVLLLSATPIHNAGRELDALLALFLGRAAYELSPGELARHIVRRASPGDAGTTVRTPHGAALRPRVEPPRWLRLPAEDDLLEELASLPSPVPPRDGDDGGALLLFSLLRQWASSHGALAGALRRRLARAMSLIAALEEGRHPTQSELAAWHYADEAVQLAFPSLIASTTCGDLDALLVRARTHEARVRSLLRRVERSREVESTDRERAARLRELRDAHPGEKIVVFSQFADSVDALFRELRADAGVGALAGRGARVAGGALTRTEAIRRFAPRASDCAPPAECERIDLLLATDLLSEGVNLQDASVVVHLDLPWTPARLEQRVGRAARPGAARDRVAVYAFAPPASAERVLAVERRLLDKLRTAARAVGAAGVILPSLIARDMETAPPSPTQCAEQIRRRLKDWRQRNDEDSACATTADAPGRPPRVAPACSHGDIEAAADAPNMAAVSSRHAGAIVLLRDGRGPRLLAWSNGVARDDPNVIADLLSHAEGPPLKVDARRVQRLLRGVENWLGLRELGADAELRRVRAERARQLVLRRVAAAVARAPAHARARVASLAAGARTAATLALGAGGERILRELAVADLGDEAWLRAVAEFASLHRQPEDRVPGAGTVPGCAVMAILMLVPAHGDRE